MKDLYICIFLILSAFCSNAQQSKYWGKLAPGAFKVGYQDTIVFNPDQGYELVNYEGPKPYFINFWFPLVSESGDKIKYDEYLQFDSNSEMQVLIDSIQKVQNDAFISWGVTYNLDSWENSSFSKAKSHLASQMLQEELDIFKTSYFPATRYPTIIYHHGNGGISFENSVLFEFLSSHGYVIIAADYHWPNLRENSYTKDDGRSLDDVEFIVDFAETLPFTDSGNLYYLGHSWGGGQALRLNHRGSIDFKRYIIFDSTIEKVILPEMTALNPHLDSLFRNHSNSFKTNTTVITARASYYSNGDTKVIQPFPEFIPFQFLDKRYFTFITLKKILNHGSFTSVEVMRSVFTAQFQQQDSTTVNEQFRSYQFLIQLTKDILKETELDKTEVLMYEK